MIAPSFRQKKKQEENEQNESEQKRIVFPFQGVQHGILRIGSPDQSAQAVSLPGAPSGVDPVGQDLGRPFERRGG